ncbi:MAG: RNA polymerase subunit sigma-70 [Cytophagaceae bacterium]|nr:RNA polymerase subunit sigma-70 [Cytophagaceae bacterium]
MEIDEEILLSNIELAQQGKQVAFNYLLNTHWSMVYHFLLKKSSDEYNAEEVTIQTFARAFDKIDTYDDSYRFSTWLLTIAKNLYIDQLRRDNSMERQQLKTKPETLKRVMDENPSPEDALIKEQNLAELLGYIHKLKPDYQKMINLRYFQEMSYKEMAQDLDEPMNNVKVKLLRARRLLADLIQNDK